MSYNIPVWEIMMYKFEYGNDEWIIIDERGNKYKKISDNIENWYMIPVDYIAKIVLNELINTGDIIVENGIIIIPSLNNKRFGISLQPFPYTVNANLYLVDDYGNTFILEIMDNEYIFFRYDRREKNGIIWSKKL